MKTRHKASLEFLQVFQKRMPLVEGYLHAGTELSIGASLAGTSLFRAVNKTEHGIRVAVLSKEIK